MSGFTRTLRDIRFTKPFWPVFGVLAVNLLLSLVIGSFTFIGGNEALWEVSLRYLCLSLILVLSLFLLSPLSGFLNLLHEIPASLAVRYVMQLTVFSICRWQPRPSFLVRHEKRDAILKYLAVHLMPPPLLPAQISGPSP